MFSLKFSLYECFIIAKLLIIIYKYLLETIATHINHRT